MVAGERGQAAIEVLLVFPVFLLLVLMAVDFGIWMYESVSVANAARAGVRFGSVNCGTGSCTEPDVQAKVINSSGGILNGSSCIEVGWVDRNSNSVNRDKGDSVVVNIKHNYDLLFFPFTVGITSSADMRLEKTDNTTTLPAPAACP